MENMLEKKEILKDKRLPKQRGDFGEMLALFILGSLRNYRVAVVDHVGADLIATDPQESGNKYAISVKTRMFATDGPDTGISLAHQEALTAFADSFDLIPAICFVMMDFPLTYIDVYMMTLENFGKLARDPETLGLKVAKDQTLRISNAPKNRRVLQNHMLIDHTRFKLDGQHPIFAL